jgi:hypothetical protein
MLWLISRLLYALPHEYSVKLLKFLVGQLISLLKKLPRRHLSRKEGI